MKTAPLLRLDSVTKKYGDVSVLRKVDLQLKVSERVALTGPVVVKINLAELHFRYRRY